VAVHGIAYEKGPAGAVGSCGRAEAPRRAEVIAVGNEDRAGIVHVLHTY
jgi:hypothetical protein